LPGNLEGSQRGGDDSALSEMDLIVRMLGHLVFRRILKVQILLVLSPGMLYNPWILGGLFMKRPNGEGRSGRQDQQQRGNRKFLHGWNVARESSKGKYPKSLDPEK
jgi:hypothetical protein